MIELLNLDQEKFAMFLTLSGILIMAIFVVLFSNKRRSSRYKNPNVEIGMQKNFPRGNESRDAHEAVEVSMARRIKALERESVQLRELVKMKEEVLRVVSHELRTPMDVIRGNLDMVLKGEAGKVNAKAGEYLGDSLEAANRLSKLVQDMLDFSRLEGGRLEFKIGKFNIVELIEKLAADFRVLADKKKLKLIFVRPEKELPPVLADRDKTTQALDNLIGNAIKFTPRGQVEISLRKEEKFVVVSVKDTGIGIREEDQPKLFKKFPQIDNGEIQERGSGLGLYISSEILSKMDGKIWAKSGGRGKGTTFSFALPFSAN